MGFKLLEYRFIYSIISLLPNFMFFSYHNLIHLPIEKCFIDKQRNDSLELDDYLLMSKIQEEMVKWTKKQTMQREESVSIQNNTMTFKPILV